MIIYLIPALPKDGQLLAIGCLIFSESDFGLLAVPDEAAGAGLRDSTPALPKDGV